MHLKAMKAFLVIGVLAFANAANAGLILVSGNSMDNSNPIFTTNLAKLSEHTFQFDAPINFASLDLSGFSAVWLDGFSQYTSLTSLTPYLNAGGTVLVQNPGFGSEPLTDYPETAGLAATFEAKNAIRIVNPGHPLNAGLSDANLSGWNQSAAGFFTGALGGFTALSDDGQADEFITLFRKVGAGNLIYTQQLISQSLSASDLPVDSGQLRLLNNILSISASAAAPEPSAILLIMVGLGGTAILRRRSR